MGKRKSYPVTLGEFEQVYRNNESIALVDPSAIIHRSTFLDIGGYRSEYTPAGDLDLWYRIAETGKAVLSLPEYLFKYRVHVGSDSVKRTMLQRKKTHFINYNMRQRRAGNEEISWEEFCKNVWSKPTYKIPRLRNDIAMTYYKKAGLNYGKRNWKGFILNITLSFLLKPSTVIKRLSQHKLSR
jgi:hypothetical protein